MTKAVGARLPEAVHAMANVPEIQGFGILTVRDQYAAQMDGLVRGGRHTHAGDMYDSRM